MKWEHWFYTLPLRLRSLFRRSAVETELDEEFRHHLDLRTEENVASGMTREEARLTALRGMDGLEQRKEECRDARRTQWLQDLLQDSRYALRTLRQNRGFAAVVLGTLALGIGATTLMFTVINGVLLKPLPYPEPERLVVLQERTEQATQYGNLWAFTYPNYTDALRESRTLTIAASRARRGALTGVGESEFLEGREISPNWFPILGISISRGRAFQSQDDLPGAAPVAILTHALWQRQFHGDPGIIGRSLTFDSQQFTVAGVLPADSRLFGTAEIFFPLGPGVAPIAQNRRARPGLFIIGRLNAGVTLDQARAELDQIGHRVAAQYPETNQGRTFVAEPLRPDVGNVQSVLWLLLGAVALVLLIACVNVASLQVARAVGRHREFVMRAALGARRGRLLRQCLTESAVLGITGGTAGVALAIFGLQPFLRMWPSLPRIQEIELDWRVLSFALAVSLASSLVFGLAPALRLPTRGLERAPRGGAQSGDRGSRRLHAAFVIAEITLAVVLLISAGLLGSTLIRVSSLDPGLNADNVLVARMALSRQTLQTPGRARAAWDDVLRRARAVPGVESAATVDTVPMRAGNNQLAYWPNAALPPGPELPLALATSVSPEYFKVMGIQLLKGRFIQEQDRAGSDNVIVIDEVLAQLAFPEQEATGKRLWLPNSGFESAQVVGVVRHVRHWGLAGDDQQRVRAQFYYPFAQLPDGLVRRWSELMSVAVRTSIAPDTIVPALRKELAGASGDQVLYEIRTMDQLARDSIVQQRFLLSLFSSFAAMALLLACLGVYGVLTYTVSRRVPEIGVRIALGANGRNVAGMILGQCLKLLIVGLGLGVIGAVGAGRLIESLVEGARQADPAMFAAMTAIFAAAALLASYLPARRASRVDPLTALRQD